MKIAAATLAFGSLLASCQEEESTVAKAVLGDVSSMTFAAKNPAAQTVTVYSDGDWHTTAPEWISVDPATGNGTTLVTVTYIGMMCLCSDIWISLGLVLHLWTGAM